MRTTRKKRGRPTDYDPKYCQQVIDHMAQGKPLETFGAKVGVERSTLYNWAERHPEFFYAIKIGRDKSLDWWTEQGRKAVTGKVKSFNATVWIFALKNMHKWRESEADPLAMIAARAQAAISDKKEMNEQEKLEYAIALRRDIDEFIKSREPILDAKSVGMDKDPLDERSRNDVGKLPVALSDLKR